MGDFLAQPEIQELQAGVERLRGTSAYYRFCMLKYCEVYKMFVEQKCIPRDKVKIGLGYIDKVIQNLEAKTQLISKQDFDSFIKSINVVYLTARLEAATARSLATDTANISPETLWADFDPEKDLWDKEQIKRLDEENSSIAQR